MKALIGLLLISCSIQVAAQTAQLSGIIQDASTQDPLPYASIFVNNTTIGTKSNVNGQFTLNLPEGISEVVFSFVGYQTFQTKLNLHKGESVYRSIKLLVSEQMLSNVEVKGASKKEEREWEKNLKKFEKIFLGEDAAGSSCKILNPWIIDFPKSPDKAFIAIAEAPIEIINKNLGYKLYFHLNEFKSTPKSYSIGGTTQFEELIGDPKQVEHWAENRRNAYSGSLQHLFKAILDHRIHGEGFNLYTDNPGATKSYRSSYFFSELGKSVIPYDTTNLVSHTLQKTQSQILVQGRVEIHYTREYAANRTYKDIPYPVSWIETKNNYALVNDLGIPSNQVITSGEMNANRVSHLLPQDYNQEKLNISRPPPQPPDLAQAEEKVYLHTDKSYYYPGETIWLKGYMNYKTPKFRDSLSRVLHVELISPTRHVAFSRTLRIDSGFTKGDIALPDTVRPGNYFLRAYTEWMRNYGTEDFFVKPLTILSLYEKADPTIAFNGIVKDSLLSVQSSKPGYHLREKIELFFQAKDEEGDPIATNLSVSVTDAKQVVPIVEDSPIGNYFPWPDNQQPVTPSGTEHNIEHGIVISGSFINDKQKPQKTELSMVRGNFEDLLLVDVNRKGEFCLNGLDFNDTVQFSFQAKNQKGKRFGKTILNPPNIPDTDFEISKKIFKSFKTETQQQIASRYLEYKLRAGEILLGDVTVKAKRIKEQVKDSIVQHKIYGSPDWIVKGADLVNSGPNLIVSLQGRVPGLQVFTMMSGGQTHYVVRVRGGKSSILAPSEPLVIVDGIIMGGQDRVVTQTTTSTSSTSEGDTAGDRMSVINPNNVERVEVTTRVNSMYGAQGANGVIAIYTKSGEFGASREKGIESKTFDIYKIAGFSKVHDFLSPNYGNPETDANQADYRTTIYWNPMLTTNTETGKTSVAFYAADIKTRYRVVVVGLTQKGNPVRSEFSFDIN